MRYLSLLLLCACSQPAAAAPPSQAPEGFWDHWGDGQGELNSYDLVIPRYGHLRTGTAVLVYVTETFAANPRVKSDGGHDDEFPVMKLNDVRDFPTGIYDYNVLTSTFVPLDGRLSRGQPTKVSLSVQEWCGNVYDELIVDPGRYERVRHSYFDGESGEWSEEVPEGAVFGDALPLVVRGVAGDLLAPGESRTAPYLPTLLDTRLSHQPLAWTEATLSRSEATSQVEVPAGVFEVYSVTVEAGGITSTWDVEAAYPHKLVRWKRSTGEEAVLRGSMRSPYWKHNDPDGRALLPEMGL